MDCGVLSVMTLDGTVKKLQLFVDDLDFLTWVSDSN